MRIQLTDAEQAEGKMGAAHLDLANRLLREVGAVILEGAVPLAIVKEAQRAYSDAIRQGRTRKIRHAMEMPFLHHQFIANLFALQVIESAMGKKVALFRCGIHDVPPDIDGNQVEKAPHRDGNHLFPELPCVLPVSGIYVNIPFVDFLEENGATKIWPGSHLIMDSPPSDVRYLGERSKHLPALQAVMPMGSLMLRDMRLWHVGMPNRTDTHRPMLDIGYTRVFPHASERLRVPQEIKQHWSESAKKLLRTG